MHSRGGFYGGEFMWEFRGHLADKTCKSTAGVVLDEGIFGVLCVIILCLRARRIAV